MDNEHPGSPNSGSRAVTSAPADIAEEKTALGTQIGAALSKVSEAAQHAGNHLEETAHRSPRRPVKGQKDSSTSRSLQGPTF